MAKQEKVNKSELVRQVLAAHPQWKARQVCDRVLKEHAVRVTPGFVRNVGYKAGLMKSAVNRNGPVEVTVLPPQPAPPKIRAVVTTEPLPGESFPGLDPEEEAIHVQNRQRDVVAILEVFQAVRKAVNQLGLPVAAKAINEALKM